MPHEDPANASLPALQERVARFVAEHHLETDVPNRLLDAVSELGELAKEVLKGSNYGRERFAPPPNWDAEMGDVLFSLICLANSTGVDLRAATEAALQKYERRKVASGRVGSGR